MNEPFQKHPETNIVQPKMNSPVGFLATSVGRVHELRLPWRIDACEVCSLGCLQPQPLCPWGDCGRWLPRPQLLLSLSWDIFQLPSSHKRPGWENQAKPEAVGLLPTSHTIVIWVTKFNPRHWTWSSDSLMVALLGSSRAGCGELLLLRLGLCICGVHIFLWKDSTATLRCLEGLWPPRKARLEVSKCWTGVVDSAEN